MAYTDVCGKKLAAKMGAVLNESATSHSPALLPSHQSFAKRQLEKMGWSEGTGLGKRRDGRSEYVKIKQREDEVGLGREKEKAKEMANQWWSDSVGGTLARLQQQKKKKGDKRGKKDKRKKSKRTSDSDVSSASVKTYTDEELFAATGGARFGMRAQRRAEGKWQRTESGSLHSELEEQAKNSMEWNGRGKAQVLVDGEASRKRKSMEGDSANSISPEASGEESNDSESTEKREKKKRKIEAPASSGEEEISSDKSSSKKKKSKKKGKKSKKSSKRAKES
ncbi:hypothetical protein ACHAXT_003342 [Thalassiosira profunda]